MRTSLVVILLLAAMPALAQSESHQSGRQIYVEHCAVCHGIDLKGEPGHPDWRQRKPNGRLPAPPHDESGHTWHHSDKQLFAMTKFGPARLIGDPNYPTDMPGFEGVVSDDPGLGVDQAGALGHQLRLGLAHGPTEGVKLSVEVGDADVVEVDQAEGANARAGQGLCGIAADPAEPYDQDTGSLEGLPAVATDQQLCAVEGVHAHAQVELILARVLHHVLVRRNATRLHRLGGDLLLLETARHRGGGGGSKVRDAPRKENRGCGSRTPDDARRQRGSRRFALAERRGARENVES